MMRATFTGLLTLFISGALSAQVSTVKLLGEFDEGWEKQWTERKLGAQSTGYEVVLEDDNRILQASGKDAASGLWRLLDILPGKVGKISWRWKVDKVFDGKPSEKTKRGDDFAARIYIVFEPHFVNLKTKAICYVWAAKESVGNTFKNPYADTVEMIVIQSGKENRGEWMKEERDFIADCKNAFGKEPTMVTAVAVMVDTDNTQQEALSWFDDLVIEYSSPEEPEVKKPSIILNN